MGALYRTLAAACLAILAPVMSLAQGLPIATLKCTTTISGIPVEGDVHISLFTYGGGASLGNATERQQIKFMILEGRAHEIPGLLNVIGIFQAGADRMDFDVMLTRGTEGTGQYWFNGMSHRGIIFDLALVQGGMIARDEKGNVAEYRCQ
jgi:hypothetical protein